MAALGSEGSYAASRARVCFAVLAKPLRHLALDKSRQVALEVTATSRKRSVFLRSDSLVPAVHRAPDNPLQKSASSCGVCVVFLDDAEVAALPFQVRRLLNGL